MLLHKVDEELTHEKAVRIAAYETDLKENCDNIARNPVSYTHLDVYKRQHPRSARNGGG